MTCFQCVTWNGDDSLDNDEIPEQYNIKIFGRNENGKSVCCNTSFNPYFFIELPSCFKRQDMDDLITFIQKNLWIRIDDSTYKTYKNIGHHLILTDSKPMKMKKFYGFTNNQDFLFLKLVFKTKTAFDKCLTLLKKNTKVENANKKFTIIKKTNEETIDFTNLIYEANVDPLIRFMHVKNIKSAGWIDCKKCKKTVIKSTNCDIEIDCSMKNIHNKDEEKISPLVIASFDIETYSPDGRFPDHNKKQCPIIQIATCFQRYGESEPYLKHLVNLGTCDPIEDCVVVECKTESELIQEFAKIIQLENADIITGYNIWKFDFNYIIGRAKLLKIQSKFVFGKLINQPSESYTATFSSSAYGDNDYTMLKTPGMTQIDLFELIKREHKLTKYTLDAVSEHFLKERKVDLPYKEMFEKFKGTASDRRDIGIYCIQDTVLPLKIISKLNIIPNLVEMAKATIVPINYLLERGQQIKVFSQILYETRKQDMLVQTIYDKPKVDSFIGATVLNAKKGAYMDKIVTGLDFASLYPTIMRAHNLCYNTIVFDDKYKNLDDIEYQEIKWDTDQGIKTCTFVQNKQGILPLLLENLAKNRKLAKKEMSKAHENGNKFMESVYNGKQLAFKVSMNSIYGFCAAQMLPCPDISASVTTIGRNMIEQTKTLVEKWYDAEVIYGDTDSVMTIFNIGDLKGEEAMRKTFEIGKEAADRISKTFKYPIELEFEKCYSPYLLFSKKRYAGLMYTKPEKYDYIDAKGIQLVRRDNCKLVKNVSKDVLDQIMYNKDINAAIKIVQNTAKKLLKSEIDIDDLIVSKSLRKNYASQKKKYILNDGTEINENNLKYKNEINNFKKDPDDSEIIVGEISGEDPNLPHFTVAKKIEERSPGTGPKCGERVPYVFIDTYNKKDLQYQKAEDPTYAKQNNLKLDVNYYLEHALTNPMQSLFELFMKEPKKELFECVLNDKEVLEENKRRTRSMTREMNKRANQQEISMFFKTIK